MDWIQQWQSKFNKQNEMAPLVRTGGSRHTGLAALPHRNIQSGFIVNFLLLEDYTIEFGKITQKTAFHETWTLHFRTFFRGKRAGD